jgi:hypothetical protein
LQQLVFNRDGTNSIGLWLHDLERFNKFNRLKMVFGTVSLASAYPFEGKACRKRVVQTYAFKRKSGSQSFSGAFRSQNHSH